MKVHRTNEDETAHPRRPARRAPRGRRPDAPSRSPSWRAPAPSSSSDTAASPSPSPSPTLSAAHISITPGNGARQAKPHKGITVTVRDGTLTSVTARSGGAAVAGELDATSTTWQSRWTLSTGKQYVGARHGGRRRRPERHQDEPLPHAEAGHDRRRPDLPGAQRHLRRRDAGDDHVQQARREQEGGRERARPEDLAPGRRRLVLGRRPGALVPPARLLAAEHQGAASSATSTACSSPPASTPRTRCGRTSGSDGRSSWWPARAATP